MVHLNIWFYLNMKTAATDHCHEKEIDHRTVRLLCTAYLSSMTSIVIVIRNVFKLAPARREDQWVCPMYEAATYFSSDESVETNGNERNQNYYTHTL
jgi:hypothetical protein